LIYTVAEHRNPVNSQTIGKPHPTIARKGVEIMAFAGTRQFHADHVPVLRELAGLASVARCTFPTTDPTAVEVSVSSDGLPTPSVA